MVRAGLKCHCMLLIPQCGLNACRSDHVLAYYSIITAQTIHFVNCCCIRTNRVIPDLLPTNTVICFAFSSLLGQSHTVFGGGCCRELFKTKLNNQ